MIELDLYSRLNNKFIFGPDLSVKNSWWTSAKCSINFSFRKWGSTFEACWKLNDIRHCTIINVFRRDSSSPGSPSIWLHYSFKPKKVSFRDSFSPWSPVPQKRLDVPHLIHCKTSQYMSQQWEGQMGQSLMSRDVLSQIYVPLSPITHQYNPSI